MSAVRTKPPLANAANLAVASPPKRGTSRGVAVRFPESGRSNQTNPLKSNPDIRCDPVLRLTCGQSGHSLQEMKLTTSCGIKAPTTGGMPQ